MDNSHWADTVSPTLPDGARAHAALAAAPGPMAVWLTQRHRLVEALTYELRAGFQAVAAFQAPEYLDAVERQQGLAQRILTHDRAMPLPDADAGVMRQAAAELRRMNRELKRLNDIQAALIENGGRSVRCFQRVWAMAAPAVAGYADPSAASWGGR
ncbi:MAG TPA: hypothetical protein VFP94_07225 [Terriglobales bacterium]|nr:hypothetical protein [Terriglobales bacterium]